MNLNKLSLLAVLTVPIASPTWAAQLKSSSQTSSVVKKRLSISDDNPLIEEMEQWAKQGELDRIKSFLENYNLTKAQIGKIIHEASRKGKSNIVEYLLRNKLISVKHRKTCAAFRDAVDNGHHTLAKYLLDQGVDINAKSLFCRDTALAYAARRKYVDMMEYLIENGAKYEKEALMEAILYNSLESVKCLMEKYGVGKSAKGEEYPLYVACKFGSLHVVKYLIDEHNMDFKKPCYAGDSPLDIAKEKKREKVVNYLNHLSKGEIQEAENLFKKARVPGQRGGDDCHIL